MRISIIIIVFICINLLFSCSEEFDLTPDTQIAESPSLFQNEAGLNTFVNGFYNYLDVGKILDDFNSDNMEHISTPPAIRSSNYVLPTALGSGGWNWSQLRNINYFIQNVNEHTEDINLKNKYLGYAKFFRALFYFDKVKSFGDVPWYSSPLSTTDDELLYKERDSRVVVMDSVLNDINFAVQHLEPVKSKNKITKWTALALKSRITLFEGTWRKYHEEANLPNADTFLKECIDASKELIDANVYSLYNTGNLETDYAEMFQLSSAPTDEIILARSSTQLFLYYTPNFTSTSNGNYGATFSLISDYPMINGESYYHHYNDEIYQMEYFDEFIDRDYRLKQSVVFPGYIRIGTDTEVVNDFAQNRTGYQVTKRVGPPIEDQGSDDRDVILIRYAEILLNYAEARAVLNEITQEDIDLTLNAIRARAGIDSKLELPFNTDALQIERYTRTKDPIVLEICRERRIELAFEGFRKDDLLRWKEGHLFRSEYEGIYIKGYNEYIDLNGDNNPDLYVLRPEDTEPSNKISGVQYFRLSSVNGLSEGDYGRLVPYDREKQSFKDWEYLNPIPLEELTLNENLKQNPGWER